MADLDDKLAAAMERLAQGRRAFWQAAATRSGLSPLQLDVLTILDAADRDGDLAGTPAGQLAARLDVAASTVTDAVAALRRKGLVREEPDRADRRRRPVQLTDVGRRAAATARVEGQVLQEALGAIDPAAKARALEVILDVIGHLHRRGIITVDRSCKTCRFHRPEGGSGGYCALLEQPLTRASLRVDCPEHAVVVGHPPAG